MACRERRIIQIGFILFALMCIGQIRAVRDGYARPVSYPGGWTLMTMNDSDKYSTHVHYSPTKNYSVGYKAAYWRDKGFQSHSVQINNLIKRWNKIDSQANLYLKSGAGLAYDSSHDYADGVEPHWFTGMAADWEDRRYFIGYANSYHYSGEIDESYRQYIHLGITPYIGEYGDLHTWLMLKVAHEPGEADEVTLIPHLRFFKGEYLLEVGYSDDDEVMLNMIVRF